MLNSIIQLALQLLKERESNRQLLLAQCVEPLLVEVGKLHRHHVESLSEYKSEIQSGKLSIHLDLTPTVARDQDIAIAIRAEIKARASTLYTVADQRLDGIYEDLGHFMLSVAQYLENADLCNVPMYLSRAFASAVSVANPTYTTAMLVIGSETVRNEAIKQLDSLVLQHQLRYTSMQQRAAELRAKLLA